MKLTKFSAVTATIAALALTLAVAAPVASPASAAPGLGTPIVLPAFSTTSQVAFSPDGRKAYVANYGTSTVSVITVATGALGTPITLPANSYPVSIAISPDGTTAYVANVVSDTVSVISFTSEITSVPRTLRAGTTTARSVALRWSAPASLNDGVITDYLIQYRRTGTSNWLTFAHTPSAALTRVVTGLSARTKYQFKVAAKTAAGTSPFTAPITKTTLAR